MKDKMLKTVLVVGATGMTGRSLIEQLLGNNHKVRAIVRSPHKFPSKIKQNQNITFINANLLDLSNEEMAAQVKNCDAVVSCLGHSLTFHGMFGSPRKLCTDATERLIKAIEANRSAKLTKFILMNTVGVQNTDCNEKRRWFERGFLAFLRHTVPPHRDNETAAGFLFQNVNRGKNNNLEWSCVRPDSLINAEVSSYKIDESPTSGIFSGFPTSRANVAHFMTKLIENEDLWNIWKFRMPVIMNSKG